MKIQPYRTMEMKLRPYFVEVVVWKPVVYRYRIEAPNELTARQAALEDSRKMFPSGEHRSSDIPVRTTLLKSNRIRS